MGGNTYSRSPPLVKVLLSKVKGCRLSKSLCGFNITARYLPKVQVNSSQQSSRIQTNFCKEMVDSGSEVRRFKNTQQSAQAILDVILANLRKPKLDHTNFDEGGNGNDEVLQIQKELVDFQRCIPETNAGQALCYTLQQWRELQKQTAEGSNPDKKARTCSETGKVA